MRKKSQNKLKIPKWGLLPKQVRDLIRKREWETHSSLKARLLGSREFPIRISLKPPSGSSAISDLPYFQKFIEEWKLFPHQELVIWTSKSFRNLNEQSIPIAVEIPSIQSLIAFLGDDALSRSKVWERNMMPILEIDKRLYPVLVKHINLIEGLTLRDAELLAQLIPQLKQDMGIGLYLRALPLIGIDTKFLEKHYTLVEELADIIHDGIVLKSGGLIKWLGCAISPKGWLTIRPLCQVTINALSGIPILQMPSDLLREYELPSSNILAVENLQSGLALPEMHNTIAVIGGGKNITWMDAVWLKRKRIGYWGDIDTWGFSILSDARERHADIESLMMDYETVKMHEDRLVPEPEPNTTLPLLLNNKEMDLFNNLISGPFKSLRLEQERLSSDYIRTNLMNWL